MTPISIRSNNASMGNNALGKYKRFEKIWWKRGKRKWKREKERNMKRKKDALFNVLHEVSKGSNRYSTSCCKSSSFLNWILPILIIKHWLGFKESIPHLLRGNPRFKERERESAHPNVTHNRDLYHLKITPTSRLSVFPPLIPNLWMDRHLAKRNHCQWIQRSHLPLFPKPNTESRKSFTRHYSLSHRYASRTLPLPKLWRILYLSPPSSVRPAPKSSPPSKKTPIHKKKKQQNDPWSLAHTHFFPQRDSGCKRKSAAPIFTHLSFLSQAPPTYTRARAHTRSLLPLLNGTHWYQI